MTSKSNNDLSKLELTEKLTWELLDEQLSDSRLGELEDLMREDADCLQCYVSCVQLEQDLKRLFHSGDAEQEASPKLRQPGFPRINLASDGTPAMPSQ